LKGFNRKELEDFKEAKVKRLAVAPQIIADHHRDEGNELTAENRHTYAEADVVEASKRGACERAVGEATERTELWQTSAGG
jgi:hypothetical protein